MQKLLQTWLEPAGYETATASNGEQALNSLGQSTFDLALVDYLMPRMNGLSVLEQISQRRIPVGPLLLTANYDLGLVIEAMRRGALDCIMKPTPVENLLLVLDETMERHWARELGLPLRVGATAICRGRNGKQPINSGPLRSCLPGHGVPSQQAGETLSSDLRRLKFRWFRIAHQEVDCFPSLRHAE